MNSYCRAFFGGGFPVRESPKLGEREKKEMYSAKLLTYGVFQAQVEYKNADFFLFQRLIQKDDNAAIFSARFNADLAR